VKEHQARLYIARQWVDVDLRDNKLLGGEPGVAGLVYSTFRFDNPAAVQRGNFIA
jgi:hypothetical protein